VVDRQQPLPLKQCLVILSSILRFAVSPVTGEVTPKRLPDIRLAELLLGAGRDENLARRELRSVSGNHDQRDSPEQDGTDQRSTRRVQASCASPLSSTSPWNGDAASGIIVPVDHLGNELIRFGIEPNLLRVGDREPATADFGEIFSRATGDGTIQFPESHREPFLTKQRNHDHPTPGRS